MYNYESKLVDSSRLTADIIVADIGNSDKKYTEILELTLRDEYPKSMRAARILALATRNNCSLFIPHLPKVIDSIGSLKVEGVKRGFLYILAELPVELTEEMLGIVTDCCFTWLTDTKEAIAIRYYAIEILVKDVHLRTSPYRATSNYRQRLAKVLFRDVIHSAWIQTL